MLIVGLRSDGEGWQISEEERRIVEAPRRGFAIRGQFPDHQAMDLQEEDS
jgi:hypothetical protein